MSRIPSVIAISLVALMLVPTLVSAQAWAPEAPPARTVATDAGPLPLDCPGDNVLAFPPDAGPEDLLGKRDRFAVVTLTRAEGPVSLDGEEVATLASAIPTYLLLRLSDVEAEMAFTCVPGGTASVRFLDAPIIETMDTPTRVVSLTFMRSGLTALGMTNYVDVHVVTPLAGNVSLSLTAQGSAVPETVQAFGEDVDRRSNATAAALDRLVNDPLTQQEVADTLVRMGLVCSDVFGQYYTLDLVIRCEGAELENLVERIGLPGSTASSLAHRLATDTRCGSGYAIANILPYVEAVQGGGLPPIAPCISEWLDEALSAELAISTANATANAIRVAGLSGVGTSGPCGDDMVRLFPSPGFETTDPFVGTNNRTMPSRQMECAELLAASLRPVRWSWREGLTITRMGSLNYGPSFTVVPSTDAGESVLTLATQGPVVLDLTIDLSPLPNSVGDVFGRGESVAEDAGLPLDVPTPAEDAEALRLDGHVAEDAALLAAARANGVASPAVLDLLAALAPERCALSVPDRNASLCGPSAPPLALSAPNALDAVRTGALTVWSQAPAVKPPPGTPLLYSSEPEAILAALLSPPGTAMASQGPGLLAAESQVFVPHRLDVRFASEAEVNARLPSHPLVETRRAGLEQFAAARYEDLRKTLLLSGVSTPGASGPIAEVVLTGTTFWLRSDLGLTTVTRVEGSTFRLANLAEGIGRGTLPDASLSAVPIDLDLDALDDRREAQFVVTVELGASPDLVRGGHGLDPANPDSDLDGMPDGWEVDTCTDRATSTPQCPGGLLAWTSDAALDADADGLTNREEHDLTFARSVPAECFARWRWTCVSDLLRARLVDACAEPPALVPSGGAAARDGDCDGFEDGWETRFGFDPLARVSPDPTADPDGDAATNAEEAAFHQRAIDAHLRKHGGTRAAALAAVQSSLRLDPHRADPDGDGLPDGYEAAMGLWSGGDVAWNKADAEEVPRRLLPWTADGAADPDGDGISTREELNWSVRRLSAASPDATPQDVLRQALTLGLHPFRRDTDGDGKDDRAERDGYDNASAPGVNACLDPVTASFDCDGDGLDDRVELYVAGDTVLLTPAGRAWAEANYPCARPRTGYAAPASLSWTLPDSDGDGITDGYECWYGLDPTSAADAALDPDGDGLTSRFEHDLTLAATPAHARDLKWFAPGAGGAARVLLPALGAWGHPTDRDGDGLPDAYEVALGLDAFAADAGADHDRDGLATSDEHQRQDGDGRSPASRLASDVARGERDAGLLGAIAAYRLSPVQEDSDGDGMTDGWEVAFGLDPFTANDARLDPDADGLTNAEEHAWAMGRNSAAVRLDGARALLAAPARALDPRLADTDLDGMADRFEVRAAREQGCAANATHLHGAPGWARCFDPLHPGDASLDFDADGLTNLAESMGWNVTVVLLKVKDPDGGDVRTLDTRHVTSNPLRSDTSGGGLVDREKAPRDVCGVSVGLDPQSPDTDGDGISDHVETWQWTAVQGLPEDIDGDCHLNALDADSDGDTYAWGDVPVVELGDGAEMRLKMSEPTRHDTDGDGLADGREVYQWQAAGLDPLNADVDGDGFTPLRDADEDDDGIDDGYEFHVGLQPWVRHPPAHDSDNDTLTDLCEYHLTRERAEPACPPAGVSSDGETMMMAASMSMTAASASSTRSGTGRCIDATQPDCDHDGVPDGAEHKHGCDPGTWQDHAADGQLSACARGYLADLQAGSQTVLDRALGLISATAQPRIVSASLRYSFAFNDEGARCYYHRACRLSLQPSADARLYADVTVEDPDCDLDFANVYVNGHLVRHDGTVGYHVQDPHVMGATDLRHRANQGMYTMRAAGPYVCQTGETGRDYTFRVQLPQSLLGTGGVSNLLYGGTAYVTILAEDHQARVGSSVRRDLTGVKGTPSLNGPGFNVLDGLNDAMALEVAADGVTLGEAIFARAARYEQRLIELAAGDPNKETVAMAVHAMRTGITSWRESVAWFSTPEYAQAMRGCGFDPDAPPTWDRLGGCDAVQQQVRRALGGRVRLLAGAPALADVAWPVSEGILRGADVMFRSGQDQAETAAKLETAFAQHFDIDREQPGDALSFWDWALPAFAEGDGDSCSASRGLVDVLSSLDRSGQRTQAQEDAAAASRRFATIAYSMPGMTRIAESVGCVQRQLAGTRHVTLLADTLASDLGIIVTQFGMDLRSAAGVARTAGAGRAWAIRGAAAATLAWDLFMMAMWKTDWAKQHRAHLLVICVAGVVGFTALSTVASGGVLTGVAVAFGLWSLAGCAMGYADAGRSDPRYRLFIPAAAGTLSGFGHWWRYSAHMHEVNPSLGSLLAGVSITDDPVYFDEVCSDRRVYERKGIVFRVVLERATNGGWDVVSWVRYARGPSGTTMDQSTSGGAWRASDLGGTIGLGYYDAPQHGLYRISVVALPVFTVRGPGGETLYDVPQEARPGEVFPIPSTQPTNLLEAPFIRYYTFLGDGATPPDMWPSDLERNGHKMCPDAAFTSSAAVVRGAPVSVVPYRAPVTTATVRDLTTNPASATRTFDAENSPSGARYYWDFGDRTSKATVTRAAGTDVTHTFTPGRHTVMLHVVNSDERVIATRSYDVSIPQPTKSNLYVDRLGSTVRVAGDVRAPDSCFSFEVTLGTTVLQQGEGCSTTVRIQATAPAPAQDGQRVKLRLLTGPTLGEVASVPIGRQLAATAALDGGEATGAFVGGVQEVDQYALTVSGDATNVRVDISGQPGQQVVVQRRTATSHVERHVTLQGRQASVLLDDAPSLAGSWDVRVLSNGIRGAYTIKSNIVDQQPVQPVEDNGAVHPGPPTAPAAEAPLPPPPPPGTKRLLTEDFERRDSLTTRTWGLPATNWRITPYAPTGQKAAGMPAPPYPTARAYSDRMVLQTYWAHAEYADASLVLEYSEASAFQRIMPGDDQRVTVTCGGFDEIGRWREYTGLDRAVGGLHRGQWRSIEFSCADAPIERGLRITVTFNFQHAFGFGPGWVVDDVVVRTR